MHFEWVLPASARVELTIFDVTGRRVARVLDEPREVGEQFAVWDGRDEEGRPIPSGVYFARRDASPGDVTRLVRLR